MMVNSVPPANFEYVQDYSANTKSSQNTLHFQGIEIKLIANQIIRELF